MKKHLDFQCKVLPQVTALKSSKFPYKNYMSFLFETLKVYPKMLDALKAKFPNADKNERRCIKNGSMEMYQIDSPEKFIEVYFPYGE